MEHSMDGDWGPTLKRLYSLSDKHSRKSFPLSYFLGVVIFNGKRKKIMYVFTFTFHLLPGGSGSNYLTTPTVR